MRHTKTNTNEMQMAAYSLPCTVRILPGASKWMKDHGYWMHDYPESIDNLLAEIDCDFTDLKGDDSHYGIIIYNHEDLGIIGVHPQWLKQC
jgi:hypothetical protein